MEKSSVRPRERPELSGCVLNGFRNVVLSNGTKMPKVDKIKPLVKPKNYDETPNVRDIIAALSGNGSIIS